MAPEEASSQFPWLPGLTVTSPTTSNDWLPEKEEQRGPKCLSEKIQVFSTRSTLQQPTQRGALWLECIFSRRLHAAAFLLIGNNWETMPVLRKRHYTDMDSYSFFNIWRTRTSWTCESCCGKYLKNVRVYWKVIKNLMKWNECMKGFVICLTPLLATSSYATHQSLSLGLRNTLCSIRSYGTPLLKHHFSFYNCIEEKINLILETGCNFNSYSFQWRQSGQQRGQDRTVPGGTLTL